MFWGLLLLLVALSSSSSSLIQKWFNVSLTDADILMPPDRTKCERWRPQELDWRSRTWPRRPTFPNAETADINCKESRLFVLRLCALWRPVKFVSLVLMGGRDVLVVWDRELCEHFWLRNRRSSNPCLNQEERKQRHQLRKTIAKPIGNISNRNPQFNKSTTN